MPIMAANAQSDVRGAAWLLVSTAQQYIDDPRSVPQSRDALNNVYQLLEAFRKNVFFGPRPLPAKGHAPHGLAMLSIMPSSQRHFSEIRDAMDEALTSSFSSTPKDQAVERIEGVLRAAAAPDKYEVSEEDKNSAKLFFSYLLKQLAKS
jgi:hypothetical protein